MSEIRFKNLPLLLNDMKQSGWTIDAFGFRYKEQSYTVILQLYGEDTRKPSQYAQAALEFCREEDLSASIRAWLDFYEVRFFGTDDFCRFFGVVPGTAMRDLFQDFSEIFANSIPTKRNTRPTPVQREQMLRRCEGDNPDAIYCYGIFRNGLSPSGEQKHRRTENGNKAALACPLLWEKLREDDTISFCFTDDVTRLRSEAEILQQYLKK